jgi:CRISPR-associated endonuclease Csn1
LQQLIREIFLIAYRLALDVGTASLGLVALTLTDQNQPLDVAYSSIHIFSEPLLPPKSGGIGEPKKAARRLARQQRRLIERRSRRLRRIAHLAPLLGFQANSVMPDDGQHIHALRAGAIQERIELPDLLNVLLKLAKRRGYAGGFRVKKEGEEAGQVQGGIENLRQLITKNNCGTLGGLLNQRFGNTEHAGRGPRESLKLKELGLYAHREMLEEEFDLIWAEQSKHHAILNSEGKAYSVRGVVEKLTVQQHFKEAIFHQRPLKSVAGMVGQCALEPTLSRAPAAQPTAQAFRIEKQLADLRWGMGRMQRTLSKAQRDHIRSMLFDPEQLSKDGALTFGKIYKSLEKAGLRQEFPSQFNTDRFSRETLMGDKTTKAMGQLGMLGSWLALDAASQLRTINFIANLGSPESVDSHNWHERIEPAPKSEVVAFINEWVEAGTFDRLGKMGLDTGRAAYSIKALKQITQKMQDGEGCDEHAAREIFYKPIQPTGELLMHLPQPASTGNVVVDVALRVVRNAINQCLQTMGVPPTQVIVELSRDMALGLKARGEKEKGIDKHRRARLYAKHQIEGNNPGSTATNNDIFRYLLAQEQDFHCPYCSKRLELSETLDGNATNVDHILPRSLTQVKRERSHLVIAHRACNAAKGDHVPLEAFKGYDDRVYAIENCANILKRKHSYRKANYLLTESYEAEKLNDKTLEDFTERQFVESSWIAKLTAQWMKDICPNVSISRGELTAQLRRAWKLETVIPQVRLETKVNPKSEKSDNHLPLFDDDKPPKPITRADFERFRLCWENHHGPEVDRTDRRIDKRIDHRHHLIDALVIGLTDRSLYMGMAKGYKERMEKRAAGIHGIKPWQTPEPPLRNIREIAFKLVREVKIKHKTDRYPAGAFFQKTAYAKTYTDDGKSRIALSIDLIALTDNNGSFEKARKRISDIISLDTREIVSNEFERRISAGKDVKTALLEPIPDTRYGTLIRQVRVYQRLGRGFASGEDTIKIDIKGRTHRKDAPKEKHYLSDGYAYVALIKNEAGQIIDAISVRSADAPIFDTSEVARRIFRSDTVIDENGTRHLVHQILANGVIRTAPLIESRSWIQLGAEAGAKQFGRTAVMKLKTDT